MKNEQDGEKKKLQCYFAVASSFSRALLISLFMSLICFTKVALDKEKIRLLSRTLILAAAAAVTAAAEAASDNVLESAVPLFRLL